MKLLVVKTSSLGDVIHTLPAVTEVRQHFPDAVIDWVVEEAFVDIPALHPAVSRIIPVAIRRWRQDWVGSFRSDEIKTFLRSLQEETYDLVIDAQGLIKSALITRLAYGERCGFDAGSSRESVASLLYDRRISVMKNQHAIDRVRALFSGILGYTVSGPDNYAISTRHNDPVSHQVMFLHGSTWPSKLWPEENWSNLARLADRDGFRVLLPAANEKERSRAERIASCAGSAEVLPPMGLKDLAMQLSACRGAVSVDTGPGHLAAALDIPLVALYGPTDPALTGMRGRYRLISSGDHLPCIPCRKRNCKFSVNDYSSNIYPPCCSEITPEVTWQALRVQIEKAFPE